MIVTHAYDPETVTPSQDAGRLALSLGILSLILWPPSFAWSAGRNPDWIPVLVPVSEIGAVAMAIAAIWIGVRARRSGEVSRGALWGTRLGGATVALVVLGRLIGAVLFR